MTISRYFLSLILAAIGSSLVYLILRDVPAIIFSMSSGDPKVAAGEISSAIMTFVVGIPGMVILGFLLWHLVSVTFLRPANQPRRLSRYLIAGVLVHMLLYLGFAILFAVGPEGFDFAGFGFSIAAVLAAGSIWGMTFWKMDPHSSNNTGRFAEEF